MSKPSFNPYNPDSPDYDPSAASGLWMAKYLGRISSAEYDQYVKQGYLDSAIQEAAK